MMPHPPFSCLPFRRVLFAVALAAGATGSAPASADGAQVGREAMAEAMSRMMEAMGLFGSGAVRGGSGDVPGVGPMMDRFTDTLPTPGGSGPLPWPAGPLEGIWESPDGSLLIVQGNRYRLYQPGAGYVDGRLAIDGSSLKLSTGRQGLERRFEYALQEDRLALRGAGGQVSLYRRLRLDRGR